MILVAGFEVSGDVVVPEKAHQEPGHERLVRVLVVQHPAADGILEQIPQARPHASCVVAEDGLGQSPHG